MTAGTDSLTAAYAGAGITPTAEQIAAAQLLLQGAGYRVSPAKGKGIPQSIADLAMGYVALCLPRNEAGHGVIAGGTRPSCMDEIRAMYPDLTGARSSSLAHAMSLYSKGIGDKAREPWARVPEDDPVRLAAVQVALAHEAGTLTGAEDAEAESPAEAEAEEPAESDPETPPVPEAETPPVPEAARNHRQGHRR